MTAKGPISFPEELPISACIREIATAIDGHPVVIVAGETGSGKTTQLPKICLAMGRGLEAHIGVTQPRRIAATSVAARVASELGVELGNEVGYHIRFAKRAGPQTYVKFMTDGILLAELQSDALLRAYDTIIIDEAHERTLNIDFLLGFVKRLLPKRPDLRVIVSSATLETDRFSKFFDGAPVIEVSGRTFPVETIYRPPTRDETELADAIANTVEEITTLDPREDILVFLPGEREIRETMMALEEHALPRTTLLPLYGRLSQAEQQKVFRTANERRIVLATNVAETSLTIPGIVYVIDSGVARVNRYVARTGVTQLLVEPISKASADQRKGRAGRVRSGVCFRLYEEAEFQLRSDHNDPEILRVGLAGAILQMKASGLGDIAQFPFLDPPPKRAVDEGHRVLDELGALDAKGELTPIGTKLARLPLDPRIGRMILGGEAEGALREVVIIAAALGIQDPRERPHAHARKADELHKRFRNDGSDFASLLELWAFYRGAADTKTRRQLEKLCRDTFLSYVRMREWADVHQQLSSIAHDLGFRPNHKPASLEALHRALLPGLLSRIGMWHAEDKNYIGARQTRFSLHPSSGLARKQPPWVVVAELVETSQLFGRTAARIDPEWLETAGAASCKRSYGEPHWSERSAQVMVRERVTLFGLPIIKDRSVHFGPIDPKASRRLFILHALVRQEWSPKPVPAFVEHNRALFEEVHALRARARKSDMLADDDAVGVFFEKRVPEGVYSGKTFDAWRAEAEAANPMALFLSLSDVLVGDDAELTPERFPERIVVGGAKLSLEYRFEPGRDDDGVTIEVPVALLPQLDPEVLEWTVGGWAREKIMLLLHELPKGPRKALGSIRDAAETILSALRPFESPFLPALARAVSDLTGERVSAKDFPLDDLPPHLRFRFVVRDGTEVLGEGRDLAPLQARFGAIARKAFQALPRSTWEREGLTTFAVDEWPEELTVDSRGLRMTGYPAFVDAGATVSLRVLETRAAADDASRAGLRKLFLLGLGATLEKIERELPGRLATARFSDAPAAIGPRRQIAMRAVDEAFGLLDRAAFPRTRAAFDRRFTEGKQRVAAALAEWGKLGEVVAVEADHARALVRGLRGKPGAPKAALDDVTSQLDHLVPADVFLNAPRERLMHIPRYLRAIGVRLDRLPNGPQKDQSKAEDVVPLWTEWLRHKDALEKRGVSPVELEDYRWLLEELRVSVFAPEVRAAAPVSPQRLSAIWRELSRRDR